MVQRSRLRHAAKSKQQHRSKKLAVMDTEGRNGSFASLIESLIFFLPSVPPFCSFMFAFSEAHLHVTSESCIPQKYVFEVCPGFCSEAAAASLTGVSCLHNSSTFHLVKLDYFLCRVFRPRSTLKLLFIFSLFPSHCDFFNGNFRSVLNKIRGSFISVAVPLLFSSSSSSSSAASFFHSSSSSTAVPLAARNAG